MSQLGSGGGREGEDQTHLVQVELVQALLDRVWHAPEHDGIPCAHLDRLEDLGREVDALEVSRVDRRA